MERRQLADLELNLFEQGCFSAFYPLLQQGFWVELPPDAAIRTMLAQRCGLTGADAMQDIQTLFLNGMPVDDPDSVMLQDGDTLALSAALPGLVGASLRAGGILAGFRQSITYQNRDAAPLPSGGMLRIKLFNLLIRALGPGFLKCGIAIGMTEMLGLIQALIPLCGPIEDAAIWNQKPIPLDELISRPFADPDRLMVLKAHFTRSRANPAQR